MQSKKEQCVQIIAFLVFAFAIPLCYIFLMQNAVLKQSDIASTVLFGTAAASPTIAAIMTVLLFRKGICLTAFGKKCFKPTALSISFKKQGGEFIEP